MVSCETMKVGEIYGCQKCGLKLEVKQSCDCSVEENCETHKTEGVCCDFECCGEKMVLK